MSVTVVIPARLESSRFPRKLLATLEGKPVIQHTLEQVQAMKQKKNIVIATDSTEIQKLADQWKVQCLFTNPNCRNGTERLCELLPQLQGDNFLNVQADEILISSSLLDSLASNLVSGKCDLITPIFKITTQAELTSPHLVKIILDANGQSIYFSRAPIPYMQGLPIEQWLQKQTFWGHIGVYGYSRKALELYQKATPSSLETSESLEQLRFLDTGLKFRTLVTNYTKIAINTPEDLEMAQKYFQDNKLSPA